MTLRSSSETNETVTFHTLSRVTTNPVASCPNLTPNLLTVQCDERRNLGLEIEVVDGRDQISVDFEAPLGGPSLSPSWWCSFPYIFGLGHSRNEDRRSSAEIAIKMNSVRWNRSQNYSRIALFLIIFLFGVPYNVYSLFCYLTPQHKSPEVDEGFDSISSLFKGNSSLLLLSDTKFMASILTKSRSKGNPEDTLIKCYENLSSIEPILDGCRYWIEGVALGIVGCIGIVGNLVSLHILRCDSMRRTSFDELLTHLLVIDTVLVIFFLIESFFTTWGGEKPQWYITLYPFLLHPGKAIALSATVFMVVVVAADRQRAICHPMLYRPSALCFTLCTIAAATLNNLPRFFEFSLIYDESEADFWTTDLNEDPRYIKWSSYNELVTTIIFPLTALCYYNYKIYARIRLSCFIDLGRYVGGGTSSANGAQSEFQMMAVFDQVTNEKVRRTLSAVKEIDDDEVESPKEGKSAKPFQCKKEKSTAILLAIIIIFLGCHLLRFIIQIYEVVSSPLHGSQKLFEHCHRRDKLHVPAFLLICGNINHLLLVVNSSVNMIIYVCLGRRFRKQLRHLATAQCRLPNTAQNVAMHRAGTMSSKRGRTEIQSTH